MMLSSVELLARVVAHLHDSKILGSSVKMK